MSTVTHGGEPAKVTRRVIQDSRFARRFQWRESKYAPGDRFDVRSRRDRHRYRTDGGPTCVTRSSLRSARSEPCVTHVSPCGSRCIRRYRVWLRVGRSRQRRSGMHRRMSLRSGAQRSAGRISPAVASESSETSVASGVARSTSYVKIEFNI